MRPGKMQKVAWSIEAILDCDENNVALTTAFVALIEDKKYISQVVKVLADEFPLEKEYLFLKRVKAEKDRAFIIVSIGSHSSDDTTNWKSLNIQGIDHSKELLKSEIPSKQPQTRKQYEKSKQLWPCHFHEDKRLEAILGKKLAEVWGDKAFQTHCTNMQKVLSSSNSLSVPAEPGNKKSRLVLHVQTAHLRI